MTLKDSAVLHFTLSVSNNMMSVFELTCSYIAADCESFESHSTFFVDNKLYEMGKRVLLDSCSQSEAIRDQETTSRPGLPSDGSCCLGLRCFPPDGITRAANRCS